MPRVLRVTCLRVAHPWAARLGVTCVGYGAVGEVRGGEGELDQVDLWWWWWWWWWWCVCVWGGQARGAEGSAG